MEKKMKKVKNMLLALVVAVFALSACDIVEEPYIQGGGDNPTPGNDTVQVLQKVLLEDFTGVRCVNCPAAGELALQLQEIYPDQLIVMGIHAGMLAMPNGGFPDFRTTEGTEWWNYFGFDVNPIGTVNRIHTGSDSYGINSAEWASHVAEELAKTPVIALKVESTYNAGSRTLSVSVSGEVLEDQTEELNLVVCLMEDGIEGLQQTPDGVNPNYLHRHVFRGTLDSNPWGASIGTAPFATGFTFEKTYTYTLPEGYDAEHCAVVAYVCQSNDKAILQVEEAEMVE